MSAALDLSGDLPGAGDPRAGTDPVARARALGPIIAAAAPRIEAERALTPDVLDAMHGAALFRTLLPRACNGEEVRPATFVRMQEVIAAADASTGWCLGQASGCSMAAAYMAPEVAWEIWGQDPRAAVAWGMGNGLAEVVDGGYRVTGTWRFASGSKHATWVGGHCRVQERDGTLRCNADGQPVERTMMIRRTGSPSRMPGTSSACAAPAAIPMASPGCSCRTSTPSAAIPTPSGGCTARCTNSRPRISMPPASPASPWASPGGCWTPSPAWPCARRRRPRPARCATARWSRTASPRTRPSCAPPGPSCWRRLEEAWEAVSARGHVTMAEKVLIRLASTSAIHRAKEVVEWAYHEAGATAIFAGGALRATDARYPCLRPAGAGAECASRGLRPAFPGAAAAGAIHLDQRDGETTMALNGLNHYTIRPADLERTKDFYTEVLGLEIGYRPPLGFDGYWLYCGGQPTVHLIGPRERRRAYPAQRRADRAAGPYRLLLHRAGGDEGEPGRAQDRA